jgi:hypothetical protein
LESKTNNSNIEEILSKLRGIEKTDPELYKEAWSKLPHKTQAAILSYEANEKSRQHHNTTDHHKASHSSSSPAAHSVSHLLEKSFYEETPKAAHTHSEARDWEAPAHTHHAESPAHTHHTESSSSHEHDEDLYRLNSPVHKAAEELHSKDTSDKTTSRNNPDELEKEIKKSVSAQIPKAHQIMKHAASERHLPNTLQEVLLATQVYELELIRISIDRLAKRLEKQ